MKKEFEINFKKYENDTKGNVLALSISLNDNNFGNLYLERNALRETDDDYIIETLLGTLEFEKLIKIPEIKEIYNKHFNKEVDLFWFVENQEYAFAVDVYGKVFGLFTTSENIEKLKKNYNLFPSGAQAENASDMSLYERKQYLFAIAKGYEVLTREEVQREDKVFTLYYKRTLGKFATRDETFYLTSNIYFTTLEHAQECANFMNETNEVME